MSVFSIAIDGPCGAGKSTVARAVAEQLAFTYLDTGAMYRAIGIYMINEGIDAHDVQAVAARMGDVSIDVRYVNGAQRVEVNGIDVTDRLRLPEIAMAASLVSRVPEVRTQLVAMQRAIAQRDSVVMDGRDIGTNVLPDATLKIYLTASAETRARRRFAEMRTEHTEEAYRKVYDELVARDEQDMNRAVSPLACADDAIRIDTDHLTQMQVVEQIAALFDERRERG